jgi:hypothetical protein
MGSLLAAIVVFLLFVVISQSTGYYRSVLRVAGAEGGTSTDVRMSAAIGMASGFIVFFLLAILYLGIAHWHWFGPPPSHPASQPLISPAPNHGVAPIGINSTASPSPAPSASPSH